jgi:hypothetical protein
MCTNENCEKNLKIWSNKIPFQMNIFFCAKVQACSCENFMFIPYKLTESRVVNLFLNPFILPAKGKLDI